MSLNIVIPMAGIGNRFRIEGYDDVKPMIKIGGKPMIQLAVESLSLEGQYIFIINNQNPQHLELKKLLCEIVDSPIIIEIDYVTDGPASTALLAKEYINNDFPLVITNCDQILEWDSNAFSRFIDETDKDGIVVTYNTNTKKNSYVKLDSNGFATIFAEKEVISEYSLNGVHFWKKGKYFISSAEAMINKDIRTNNEYYISQTYNELINENKKIGVYNIQPYEHWAVGTPSDLKLYMEHANIKA